VYWVKDYNFDIIIFFMAISDGEEYSMSGLSTRSESRVSVQFKGSNPIDRVKVTYARTGLPSTSHVIEVQNNVQDRNHDNHQGNIEVDRQIESILSTLESEDLSTQKIVRLVNNVGRLLPRSTPAFSLTLTKRLYCAVAEYSVLPEFSNFFKQASEWNIVVTRFNQACRQRFNRGFSFGSLLWAFHCGDGASLRGFTRHFVVAEDGEMVYSFENDRFVVMYILKPDRQVLELRAVCAETMQTVSEYSTLQRS
jgi:hypothetical protein